MGNFITGDAGHELHPPFRRVDIRPTGQEIQGVCRCLFLEVSMVIEQDKWLTKGDLSPLIRGFLGEREVISGGAHF
jgi:hypothetical protein